MKKFFKHIVSLEEAMKKPYMTKMDLKDFEKIKKGSEVSYMGGRYKVVQNNGYTLTLKGKTAKPFDVNLGMFNHGGAIHESARRDPESIRKEYKEFKKQSISYLQKEWSRMNRVGNPKELDKEGLISDLLRGSHGDKYVDKAFESKITLDSNTLSIVDDLTDIESMELIQKLKMKQDKPMLTWKSPKGGVDVMITQGKKIRAIFTEDGDSKEQKTAMKILKVKKLGVVESIELNEIRKGDYIKQFGEIGLINKVKGKVAYVKFPDTGSTRFDPVPLFDIRKALTKHNGKDLYLAEAENKILKDLEKMQGQIDYLYDADPETQKFWKKKGFDTKDKDTIILYSYVNHWPPTKKLLDKSKVNYTEFEDPNTDGESYIVFNVNEKIELVHVYDDGGDLYGTGELVKGKTRKDRGTVYQLVKLDGKDKIWVAPHNIKLVEMSSAKDGGDKTTGKSKHDDHVEEDIETMWKKTYGEDLKKHYPGIAKILKQRPGIDKRELKRIWDETYGEDFEQEYPALWNKLN